MRRIAAGLIGVGVLALVALALLRMSPPDAVVERKKVVPAVSTDATLEEFSALEPDSGQAPAADPMFQPPIANRPLDCLDGPWQDWPLSAEFVAFISGETEPVLAALSKTASAEHLLAAALLRPADDTDARLHGIKQSLAADPTHALALWNAAGLCGIGAGGEYCRTARFTQAVEEILGDNGAHWARVARYRHDRGDVDGSLAALRRASSAPGFDFFWAEHVVLLERALASVGTLSYPERFMLAQTVAVFAHDVAHEISTICRGRAPEDTAWMAACADYAARLAAESRTLLGAMLGLGMQLFLDSAVSRTDRHDEIIEQREALRQIASGMAQRELLLLIDETFTTGYVDVLVAHGEISAMRFAQEEGARLIEDPDYDLCGRFEALNRRYGNGGAEPRE